MPRREASPEDTTPRTAHISRVSAVVRAHSALLHALVHTPLDVDTVLKTHCLVEQEVTSWHHLDCIHMHFSDNATVTQLHIAHDHEVSLGSTK